MVTDELRRYVAENLDLGHHPDDIAQGLIDQGWSEPDIVHVFDEFFPPENVESSSQFQFDTKNKKFLLLVLGGLIVALGSIVLGIYVMFSGSNSEPQQIETVGEERDIGTTDVDSVNTPEIFEQAEEVDKQIENYEFEDEATAEEVEKYVTDILLTREALESKSSEGVLVVDSNKQLVGEDNKIVIDSVTLPSPGFIKINPGTDIGVSDLLPSGTSENVEITLNRQPTSGTLRAVVYLDSNGDGIPQVDNRKDLLLTGSDGLSISEKVNVAIELPGTLAALNHLLLIEREEIGSCYIKSTLYSNSISMFASGSRDEDKEYLDIENEAFLVDRSERRSQTETRVSNYAPVKTMYISHNNGTIHTELVCLEDPIDEGVARFDEIIADIEGG